MLSVRSWNLIGNSITVGSPVLSLTSQTKGNEVEVHAVDIYDKLAYSAAPCNVQNNNDCCTLLESNRPLSSTTILDSRIVVRSWNPIGLLPFTLHTSKKECARSPCSGTLRYSARILKRLPTSKATASLMRSWNPIGNSSRGILPAQLLFSE